MTEAKTNNIIMLIGGIQMKLHKSKSILNSFSYAFSGLFTAIKQERNLKIHLCFIILITIIGIIVKLSETEWIICILLFGLVVSAELINTAIESVVDLASPETHNLAKQAKDVASSAVLVLAITSIIIGTIIFLPKIYIFII